MTDDPGSEGDDDLSSWGGSALLQTAIDTFADPIFIKDLRHRWVAFNDSFCRLLGYPRERLLNATDPELMPREQAERFWRQDDEVFAGAISDSEHELVMLDGRKTHVWTRKYPLRGRSGRVVGLCAMSSDITGLKRRLDKVSQLERVSAEQEAVIRAQGEMIDAMAVPVLQVWDRALLVPLVGAISRRRAQLVLESLLARIVQVGARVVILDITGVPSFDAEGANDLMRAVRAARLLGAESVVVGVGPETARTLVGLGVDLGELTTRATLQDGLQHAIAGAGGRGLGP